MRKISIILLAIIFGLMFFKPVVAANSHSMLLNGTNEYASRADTGSGNLDITGDMTLEAWFRMDTLPNTTAYNVDQTIISKWNSSDQRSYWFGYGTDASSVRSLFFHNANMAQNQTYTFYNVTLSVDTWYYFAVAYDASEGSADYYLATSSDSTVTKVATKTGLNTSIYNSSTATQIGACTNQSAYFDGYIDEVRIWNDIRTESELNANFKSEIATSTVSNLVGYWEFDNNLNDSSSNSYTLTDNNTVGFSTTIPSWPAETPAATPTRRESEWFF